MAEGRITRKELRAAASSLMALDYLEGVEDYEGGGALCLSRPYAGVSSIPLSANDFGAVLGFLIERHELLLSGLEVDTE